MCNRRRDTATRDANTYANDHAHVQRHGDADPDSDIVAHADPDSDIVAHADPDSDIVAHADGNADSDTVGTARTTATTRTDVDIDAKAASNSDAYSGTIADANCRDSPVAYSRPGPTDIDSDPAAGAGASTGPRAASYCDTDSYSRAN